MGLPWRVASFELSSCELRSAALSLPSRDPSIDAGLDDSSLRSLIGDDGRKVSLSPRARHLGCSNTPPG